MKTRNLGLIFLFSSIIIIGALGFASLYIAFDYKKEVFGIRPDVYLGIGLVIMITMIFLMPASIILTSGSKK
jgi:hypothetical protein